MSQYEDKVAAAILGRAEIGMAKYGVSVARTDLNLADWLQHLQEELMDAAVYIERIREEINEYATSKSLRQSAVPIEDFMRQSDEDNGFF